jgi:salicylate hydroxylase
VLNAILVFVSHVIDPAFRDDRVALERLDKAMYMINQMSRSHSCAQRAYLFLQELLKLMNSSLKYDASAPLSQEGMQFSNPISEELKEQTLHDHLAIHANDSQASHNVDFSTLLDVTQGLAENLGSQLESYSAADSVIWAWMNENVSPDDQAGNWSSSF